MQKPVAFYLAVIGVLVVIGGAFWYIAHSPSRPPAAPVYEPKPALNPNDYPRLQERLVGLVAAADPAAFAKENGLDKDFKDGKVVIVIEATSIETLEELRWAVEVLGGKVETDYDNLLQALVPLDALLKLATHPHIEYIRSPHRVTPDRM